MFWKKTSLSFHFVLLLVYAADFRFEKGCFQVHIWGSKNLFNTLLEKMPLPFKEVMLEKEALTYLQEKTGYRWARCCWRQRWTRVFPNFFHGVPEQKLALQATSRPFQCHAEALIIQSNRYQIQTKTRNTLQCPASTELFVIVSAKFGSTPGLFFPTWSVDHFPTASFGRASSWSSWNLLLFSDNQKRETMFFQVSLGKSWRYKALFPVQGILCGNILTYQNSNIGLHIVPANK